MIRRAEGIFARLIRAAREKGARGTLSEFVTLSHRALHKLRYRLWVLLYGRLSSKTRADIRLAIQDFGAKPLISIVMPVYNIEERWLCAALDSVLGQLYPHWELCIADDNSPSPHIRKVLDKYRNKDTRIKVVYRETNGHISAASNSALDIVTGEFIAPMDHDDLLTEDALFWVVKEINDHPEADLIYSDEDKITGRGRRFGPHFKPDWSPDLFYSFNVFTHLTVYRAQIVRNIGGFRSEFDGSQDYDLALRAIECIPERHIRHIPRILYHWRAIRGSVALNPFQKNYAHSAARRAILEHLSRRRVRAAVVETWDALHRVIYQLPSEEPCVSLILLSDDSEPDLGQDVVAILARTRYRNIEIITVSSDQRSIYKKTNSVPPAVVTVTCSKDAGFAKKVNLAANVAKGDILLILGSSLRPTQPDWLDEMVSHALRSEVGVVGAKILSFRGRIRHAGLLTGLNGGIAGSAHHNLPNDQAGYIGRAQIIQNFSAVNASCMAIRRSLFLKLGGFDEKNLPADYYDVDLGLRLGEQGYRVVWTPFATVRDSRKEPFFRAFVRGDSEKKIRQEQYMRSRWKGRLEQDPFFNPWLSLNSSHFTVALTGPRPAARSKV